jgi:hypothetical protein
MKMDFIDYIKDIYSGRTNEFIFKTASFIKRNGRSLGHKMYHIWEEMVKVGQGFKKLNADFKYYLRYRKGKINYKYE